LGGDAKTETGWYVYMLYCDDGSLYTGITTDLMRRLSEHNDNKLGARYTRARRPVKLAWFEQCDSRSHASVREAEIKKLDRQQKSELIILAWQSSRLVFEKAGADESVLGEL
jgi:putative endonuclease